MKELIMKHNESIEKLLDGVLNDQSSPSNMKYFVNVLKDHHIECVNQSENQVYLFGVSIPEEIIRALDMTPIWILGGSFHMGMLVEDTFPRDVDPVVRSGYGLYQTYEEKKQSVPRVVVPYHNDSFRKLAWIMESEGCEVFNLDIPSVKDMEKSKEIFHRNIKKLANALEKSTKSNLKAYKLYSVCKEVGDAKEAIRRLMHLSNIRKDAISAEVLFAIMSSYYACRDLKEYKNQVNRVIDELRGKIDFECEEKPEILLIGSPLFFPNNKLISMISELGARVSMAQNENAIFLEEYDLNNENSAQDMIRRLANHYYEKNTMPVNIEDGCTFSGSKKQVQGVIFHVLKGEVVYDYELLKYEKYFASHDIPVLRMETDYSPEDKEQLKIRIEAFIEMLRHNQEAGKYIG